MPGNSSVFRLQHFVNQNTNTEFVVIISPGESMDEYMEDPNVLPMEGFDITGDCTALPCDRELRG